MDKIIKSSSQILILVCACLRLSEIFWSQPGSFKIQLQTFRLHKKCFNPEMSISHIDCDAKYFDLTSDFWGAFSDRGCKNLQFCTYDWLSTLYFRLTYINKKWLHLPWLSLLDAELCWPRPGVLEISHSKCTILINFQTKLYCKWQFYIFYSRYNPASTIPMSYGGVILIIVGGFSALGRFQLKKMIFTSSA